MKSRLLVLALFATVAAWTTARAQLTFDLHYDPGIDANALAGFQAAAARWSAVLSDPITIRLDIGFGNLGGSILGSTNSYSLDNISYTNFKAALATDRTSASDYSAVSSLQGGSGYHLLLNQPSVAASTYTGFGNTLSVTVANARALGLYQASGGSPDAVITFNSSFSFDFTPSDGITSGRYDFVGVATHEIGHALGFYSGVDILDQNPSLTEAQTVQTPLDFFRYSVESTSLGLMDGAADTRAKYFSLNDGVTSLGNFSTGTTFGDHNQASHWQDNGGLGVMDPTAAPGELLTISTLDLQAFDVIGYNLSSVQEPATTAACLGLLAGVWTYRRRRKSAKN